MKARGSTERHQHELPWVGTPLDGHQPDALGHRGGDHLVHSIRSLFYGQRQRNADSFTNRGFCQGCVEMGLPSQEVVGIEVAEHQVCVGHGWVFSTFAVARRARVCSCAVRPDPKDSPRIDAGDAAPTRTKRVNIDHRDGDLPTTLEFLGGDLRVAVLDQRYVCAGAPHVKADDPGLADQLPRVGGSSHATGWARQNSAHRHLGRIGNWRDAAVGLHD